MLTHIHPLISRLPPDCPRREVPPAKAVDLPRRQVPRAPLPATSVTPSRVVSLPPPRKARPFRHRSYRLMRQTITLYQVSHYAQESLQVAVSPCWAMALPDVISARLSQDAWAMIPAVRQVHMPVSSLTSAAFPTLFHMGRLSRIPPLRDCTADQISRSLPFLIRSGLLVCSPPRSPLPLRHMP